MNGKWGQMGQTTTAEVRLDAGKSSAFQRLGAVNWWFRPPLAPQERDLLLPKTLKGTILAAERLGIRGMLDWLRRLSERLAQEVCR